MPLNTRLYSLLPFIHIASYNTNSLSYHTTTRLGRWRKENISNNIKYLAKHNDIICIQETHLAYSNDFTLSGVLRNWKVVYNNYNSSKNGTLIAFSSRIMKHYTYDDVNLNPVAKGRLQITRLTPRDPSKHLPLQIVNCYLPSGSKDREKSKLFDVLLDPNIVKNSPQHSYMVGDFNFIENKSDSNSSADCHFLGKTALSKWVEIRKTYRLTEISQPNHTHYSSYSANSTSTRLDRIYASFNRADLSLFTPAAYIPAIPHSPINLPLKSNHRSKGSPLCSDHFPVALKFVSTKPDNNKRDYNLPKWVPNTSEFPRLFYQEWKKVDMDAHPYKKRKYFKEAVIRAGAAILAAPPEVKQADRLSALSLSIAFYRLAAQDNPDTDKIAAMAEKILSSKRLWTTKGGSPTERFPILLPLLLTRVFSVPRTTCSQVWTRVGITSGCASLLNPPTRSASLITSTTTHKGRGNFSNTFGTAMGR